MEVPYILESIENRKRILATRDISKGTLVRKLVPGVHTVPISGQKHFCQLLQSLKFDEEKVRFIDHCYDIDDKLHEVMDDSKHIRHEHGQLSNIARLKGRKICLSKFMILFQSYFYI